MKTRRFSVQKSSVVYLALLVLAAACRTPPPPALPPAEIVQRAAARMKAMDGFHFVIDRSGGPAYLDPAETLSFRRAEGDFVAPDRARAVVRVVTPGLVTEVSVVSVAAVQWQTNVLTGQWEELPPNWGFNPAVLFDADVGLQAILAADVTDLVLAGTETLADGPDKPLYALAGRVAGERLYQMSGSLIGPEPSAVQLWLAPETFELHRVIVTEPSADEPSAADEPSVWQVDFSDFDQVVAIEPPVLSDSAEE